ncbi:DNA polymerase family X [uncultured virus]|nr:DNA polymerase family X [uncultured virus]
MSVTLTQIWAADSEALAPLLESQNLTSAGDVGSDRVTAAILYYNMGMLAAEAQGYVADPRFADVMRVADDLQQGIQELRGNDANEGIRTHLDALSHLYGTLEDVHRASTFEKAAQKVAQWNRPITLQNYKELKVVTGIGPSTVTEIGEFLTTGTSKRRKEVEVKVAQFKQAQAQRIIATPTTPLPGTPAVTPPLTPLPGATAAAVAEDPSKAVKELLMGVYGIGPVKALELYNAGYRTLEQLASAPLTDGQKVGLKWYYHFKERIPRAEIDEYVKRLETVLGPIAPKGNWLIAGSYRRGDADSGDIDILMRHDKNTAGKAELTAVVNRLVESGLVVDSLALGGKKFMGVVQLDEKHIARRLDIRLFEPEVWAYALLYNTGSQKFNILTRQRAIDLGLQLNEYELRRVKDARGFPLPPEQQTLYPAETEADISKWLGIVHLEPEQRTKDLAGLTLIV